MTPEEQKRILEEENKKKPVIPSQPAVSTDGTDVTTRGKTTSVQQSSGSSVSVGNQSGTSTSEQSGSSRSESQMQLTPEAQQAEQEARDAYMQSHGYVKAPDGTWKLNQTLFDALNIPREDLRKERERQQKENRMKQLVSGLYHSGALLSDMISAGVGGNVWKREKDDTAEKAAAENKQLRTLQLAEDAAFAEKQRKDMQDTLDKAQQQADQRRRELMKTVSTQTHENKGKQESSSSSTQQSIQNSTSVGTQTSVQGSFWDDDYIKQRYGKTIIGTDANGNPIYGSGGKDKTKTVKIPYTDDKGIQKTYNIDIPEEHYEAMGRYISSVINQLAKKGKDVNVILKKAGLSPQKTGKEKGTYNTDDILANGIIFDDPTIRAEFEKVIMEANELTPEGKLALIRQMRTYPVSEPEPEKKNWLKRTWEKIAGSEEQQAPSASAPWLK